MSEGTSEGAAPIARLPNERKDAALLRIGRELEAERAAREAAEQSAAELRAELAALREDVAAIRSSSAPSAPAGGTGGGMAERLLEAMVVKMFERSTDNSELIAMYELGAKSSGSQVLAEAVGSLGVAVSKATEAMILGRAQERAARIKAGKDDG